MRFRNVWSDSEKLSERAHALLPHVGEPQLLLSQLYYRHARYTDATAAAALALERMYEWGTAWDKRVPYAQWVHFARFAFMRARRKLEGYVLSLPYDDDGMVPIAGLMAEIDGATARPT